MVVAFRGREFSSLSFEFETVIHPILKDARGRNIPTVIARPVGEGVAAVMETRADRDTEAVLRAVSGTPGASPTDPARALGWSYVPKGEPNRMRAKRMLGRLQKEKLVIERLGGWRTTPTGDIELNRIDLGRPATVAAPAIPLPTIVRPFQSMSVVHNVGFTVNPVGRQALDAEHLGQTALFNRFAGGARIRQHTVPPLGGRRCIRSGLAVQHHTITLAGNLSICCLFGMRQDAVDRSWRQREQTARR
jgi:hypothetical protein